MPMTSKVRLIIKGIQSALGQEDVSEITTTADYYEKNGKHYLFYNEYTEDHHKIKNRLTIAPSHVELRKTGGGDSILTFRKGALEPCCYQSPVGPMELLSDTRQIILHHHPEYLELHLEYTLSMNGTAMSDYRLTVRAESLQ